MEAAAWNMAPLRIFRVTSANNSFISLTGEDPGVESLMVENKVIDKKPLSFLWQIKD